MTFFYEFWKKARVYYTLSISRGGARPPPPPLDSPLTSTNHITFNALFQDPSLTRRPKFCIAVMRLGFGKNLRNIYVFSNNYSFIQYKHNQQSHFSYDVIPSILPNTASILPAYCHVTLYDLGCPPDYTVDIHDVITIVRIRLWFFGITSVMLGLRMVQLFCRSPIKLHL